MDFMNRGSSQPQNTAPVPHSGASSTGHIGSRVKDSMKSMRIFSVALLFSVTVLLLALAGTLVFGSTSSSEHKFVNSKQLQAVFLNGGQVYFGNITSLNSEFIRVNDIYYLRVNQQVQPGQTSATGQDISLVKLGCELHGPTDEMVINREQVIFWENLKDDGQVAIAVAEYKKANPNGQQCAQPAASQPGAQNADTNTNQ